MQVLIPAAGMGKRLGDETANKTKCMVKLGDKTLIEHCLDSVTKHQITRIIIVAGFEKNKLKEFLGDEYNGTKIVYVDNDDYDKTNNIYSVFLAKDYLLEDDTILIESDLIFDPIIFEMVFENKCKDLAVVDKYRAWMDGTVVKVDDDFSISHFIPKNSFNYDEIDTYFKTVNIYKFSKSFLKEIYVPFLEAYSKALGKNEYYEQVLKIIVNLDTKHLKALTLNGQMWYEIDDAQDLDIADIMFSPPEKKFDLLSNRYGGYWRFDELIDFCYLVNPYFPPKKMIDEIDFSLQKLMQSYPSGQEVQAMLAGKMFNIPKEYIAVGNGAAELINILKNCMSHKFGIYGPTFEEYTARFQDIDLKVSKNDGFSYAHEDIMDLSKQNDGVILINPDNPTGNFIDYDGIIKILEEFKLSKKILVLDESFLDFADNGFNSSVIKKSVLKKFSNLIVIKSIGKSFGIGGLRLGVLASSNKELITKIKKDISIWNINSVSEFYLQIISKYYDEYIEACEKLKYSRKILMEGLEEIEYIQPYPSQANYIFCKLINKDSRELAIKLCNEYAILIKDCSNKKSINQNYIRIAVRDIRDNEYLLNCLQNI